MLAAAEALQRLEDTTRDLFLFDTFAGMTRPTEYDIDFTGARALDEWTNNRYGLPFNSPTRAALAEVKRTMGHLPYPANNVHYVRGRVEDTLPAQAPSQIALLRLDTDWYESTRHELVHLYPRLCPNGVLIVDDYGHFAGARKAVDEYFACRHLYPLLAASTIGQARCKAWL